MYNTYYLVYVSPQNRYKTSKNRCFVVSIFRGRVVKVYEFGLVLICLDEVRILTLRKVQLRYADEFGLADHSLCWDTSYKKLGWHCRVSDKM